MTELKPCPFCGETEIYTVRRKDERMVTFYYCGCEYCGAEVFGTTKAIVIERRNTRPNPWHTGTPTEDGWYLLAFIEDGMMIYDANRLKNGIWVCWLIGDIFKWQKIEEGEELDGSDN